MPRERESPGSNPNTPQLGVTVLHTAPWTHWLAPCGDAHADRPVPGAGSCQASSRVTTSKGREAKQPNFPLALEREGGERGAAVSQG